MRRGPKGLQLLGQTFGRWTVVGEGELSGKGNGTYWLCVCECGVEREVRGSDLATGETKSCGCYSWDLLQKRATKHGKSRTLRANIFYQARYRAKRDNLPFDLTLDDIPEIPEVCPILGIKLVQGKNRPEPTSPSLDRIIPELGYVRGNIQIICDKANAIKSNATADELLKVAEFVKRQEIVHSLLSAA